jgi:energy-coupling factor transporter transmembrane protein EcfT
MPDQTMAKLSICCLYLRIFGVNRIYARWIWFLGGLQVVINVAFIFVQAFQCKPVETNWKWWVPGTCLSRSTGVVVVEPPNSVIDFFLVILAVVMVRSLKMPSRDKWQLRFLFGLGAL